MGAPPRRRLQEGSGTRGRHRRPSWSTTRARFSPAETHEPPARPHGDRPAHHGRPARRHRQPRAPDGPRPPYRARRRGLGPSRAEPPPSSARRHHQVRGRRPGVQMLQDIFTPSHAHAVPLPKPTRCAGQGKPDGRPPSPADRAAAPAHPAARSRPPPPRTRRRSAREKRSRAQPSPPGPSGPRSGPGCAAAAGGRQSGRRRRAAPHQPPPLHLVARRPTELRHGRHGTGEERDAGRRLSVHRGSPPTTIGSGSRRHRGEASGSGGGEAAPEGLAAARDEVPPSRPQRATRGTGFSWLFTSTVNYGLHIFFS